MNAFISAIACLFISAPCALIGWIAYYMQIGYETGKRWGEEQMTDD